MRSVGSSGGGEPGCDARKSATTHGSAKPVGDESRLRAEDAGLRGRRAKRAPGGSASGMLSNSRAKPAPHSDGGRSSALYFDVVGNTERYSGHGRPTLAPKPTRLHERPQLGGRECELAAGAAELRKGAKGPTRRRRGWNVARGRTSTGPSERLTSIGAVEASTIRQRRPALPGVAPYIWKLTPFVLRRRTPYQTDQITRRPGLLQRSPRFDVSLRAPPPSQHLLNLSSFTADS